MFKRKKDVVQPAGAVAAAKAPLSRRQKIQRAAVVVLLVPLSLLALLILVGVIIGLGNQGTGGHGAADGSAAATQHAAPNVLADTGLRTEEPILSDEEPLLALAPEGAGALDENWGAATQPQDDRQVVVSTGITLETMEFEETCTKLEQICLSAGGYFSSTSVQGNGWYDENSRRTGQFTLRIPTSRYDSTVQGIVQAGNLLYREESVEDVTETHTDLQARLTSLQTQEARLLQLMERAEDLDTLLRIQSELTDVQYEIEYHQSMLRTLGNLVEYTTLQVTVYEVVEVTPPEPVSFGGRLATALQESGQNSIKFLQNFIIFLVHALPFLLFIAIVALVVVALVRRRRKRWATAEAETDSTLGALQDILSRDEPAGIKAPGDSDEKDE